VEGTAEGVARLFLLNELKEEETMGDLVDTQQTDHPVELSHKLPHSSAPSIVEGHGPRPVKKLKKKSRKKRYAFPARPKVKHGLNIDEGKAALAADLARAVCEAATYARPFLMKHYGRIGDIKRFEGLEELRTRVKAILTEKREQQPPPPPLPSPPLFAESFELNLNGVSKRTPPRKVKSTTARRLKKKTKVDDVPVELEITTRARTQLQDGCAVPELAKVKKIKPKFTKMKPAKPFEPVIDDVRIEPRAQSAMLPVPAKFHWTVESDEAITSTDIDFFLFVTPYIFPPEVLNRMLSESDGE
jgi:hypothetical protein